MDNQTNLDEISKNLKTSPELAKHIYTEQLKLKINSLDEKIYFLQTISKKKMEEAKIKGIDPGDSVGYLMEKWAKEYLNSVDFKLKINKPYLKRLDEYFDLPEEQKEEAKQWLDSYTTYYSTEIEVSIRQMADAEMLLSGNSLSKNDLDYNPDIDYVERFASVYTKFMKIKHNVYIQTTNVRKINEEVGCYEFYKFDVYLTYEDPKAVPNEEYFKFIQGITDWMDLFNGDEDTYENWAKEWL